MCINPQLKVVPNKYFLLLFDNFLFLCLRFMIPLGTNGQEASVSHRQVGKYWETDVTYCRILFCDGICWQYKTYKVNPALSFKRLFGFWGISPTTVGILRDNVSAYSLNVSTSSGLSLNSSFHGYQPLKCREIHFIQVLSMLKHLFSPVLYVMHVLYIHDATQYNLY